MTRSWLDLSPRRILRGVDRRLRPARHRDPAPRWIRVAAGPLLGAELFLAPESSDTWAGMAAGTSDQDLFAALQKDFNIEGRTIWDVGAHFGYHSLMFAALVGPGGRVCSFEPAPANLERFRAHLARNPGLAARITLRAAALSDRPGTEIMLAGQGVENGSTSGSHLTRADAPLDAGEYRQFQSVKVEADTVDHCVEAGTAPPPDCIKLDVEGAEGLVLAGAEKVLAARRPRLLVEVHHILQMHQILERLRPLGYVCTVISPEKAAPSRCFLLASA